MRPYSTLEHRLEPRGPIGERNTHTGVPPDPRELIIGSQLSQDDAAMHLGGKNLNTLNLMHGAQCTLTVTIFKNIILSSQKNLIELMSVFSSHCLRVID